MYKGYIQLCTLSNFYLLYYSASGWDASHRIENFYLSNINAEVESVGKITYGKNFQLRDIHLKVKDKSRLRQMDNVDSKIEIHYK